MVTYLTYINFEDASILSFVVCIYAVVLRLYALKESFHIFKNQKQRRLANLRLLQFRNRDGGMKMSYFKFNEFNKCK